MLQGRLWFSDGGVFARKALVKNVEEQHRRTEELAARNALLARDVRGLKSGLAAVEARARSELGMVKSGETFYLVTDP
ncbi:MAG: cell division protein FtsB [Gammaproteobacteria bacterium]|nr:cell division protein FtsB [Gammaproteobacteria bacterium]